MRSMRAAGAFALLLAVLTASGCSAPSPSALDSDNSMVMAAESVADIAIVAELYRTRSDPARGGIQLSLRNEGAAPVTIEHAALESPTLARPITRERSTEIAPGATRDLAMLLTAAVCPAPSTMPPDALVTIVLRDGSSAELRLPTRDRLGQWREWVAVECFAAAVGERAVITVRHDPALDDGPLIGLQLEIAAEAPGLELVALRDTVLFSIVQPGDGARVTSLALDGAAGAPGAASIAVHLTPARCDTHALAEDKQGTLFRLDVLLDGEPGLVTIVADAPTRGALYDAFTRACRLRG